ncbi:MAG TPA: ABC transporter ATP-binding protein [Alphaproteobacteria bacterium]|jgi:subfamily B ATP-binding cassette protein MsbA
MAKARLRFDETTQYLLRRLWRDWVSDHWRQLISVGLSMALVAGATGVYPLLIDWTYTMFTTQDPRVVWLVPVLVLGVTTVRGMAMYAQNVWTSHIVYRVTTDMQQRMFGHLLNADLSRITREAPGALISRFTNDIVVVRNAVARTVTNLIRDSLTVFALIGTMFYLDWMLSLIVLVIYPLAAVPIIEIGKRLRRASIDTQVQMGETTSLLNESLSGARMVKTYRLEEYERGRAGNAFERMYRLMMKMTKSRARLDPILEVLGGLAVGGVIAFGGYRVASGAGTVGQFTGFISALLIAAQPVRAVGTLNTVLQEGLAAVQRVFQLLDEKPAIVEKPNAPALRAEKGAIALEHVEFGYDATNALTDFSLEIPPGKTVALVGRSGAGKSTVFNLIPRLFDVRAGRVTIDGQDVRDVTFASLRDAIALVSQDIVLFNDTVKANIAFGRSGTSDEDIRAAAQAAAAHDFIVRLPDGYDTVVGDRGMRLSGGERQRLSLARAVLKDAPILLLDEATSALDAESERLVQQALARLTKGRTTLVIAHRLATVRNADLIYVLEAGRVLERGSHDELLALDGLYAKLCRLQFRGDGESLDVAEPAGV